MVLSLGMAGTLASELHEHQQAAADHHHHADWDHDTAPANPDADELPPTLHFHDAPFSAQAILNSEPVFLPGLAPSSVCSSPLNLLRPACLSSPPHRPPIV